MIASQWYNTLSKNFRLSKQKSNFLEAFPAGHTAKRRTVAVHKQTRIKVHGFTAVGKIRKSREHLPGLAYS